MYRIEVEYSELITLKLALLTEAGECGHKRWHALERQAMALYERLDALENSVIAATTLPL